MEIISQKITPAHQKSRSVPQIVIPEVVRRPFTLIQNKIKALRLAGALDEYEKRKLTVFNRLNLFQLIAGFLIPIAGLLHTDNLPGSVWFIVSLPAYISLVVLVLNYLRFYQAALLVYFLLYPLFTYIVYLQGINAGTALNFILLGVLSVFFLRDTGYMVFTVAFSMMSYFMIAVLLKNFMYQVKTENYFLYLFNQLLSLIFIFYGLFLIKKENSGYLSCILSKNHDLYEKTLKIEKHKEEIAQKATLLEKQKTGLAETDALKNKLFSIIAHDLKTPLYALRNLFQNIDQYNLPADDIKKMIPEVMKDLNYTTGLMENVLHWAKIQMQAGTVHPQQVNVAKIIADVVQLMRLQAQAKKISIQSNADVPVFVYADKDMMHMVLRNLLSNAIKFTPEGGSVLIGVNEMSQFAEVFVQDSGTGINKEALRKINENNYYTTKGTSSESGTGLGLMLCKEFLAKNGGHMHIESEEGKGSIFSFTLPRSAQKYKT
ncbi:MAG: HAMP domain-containing histidine kinase [Flavisolibacter sp.]|nr:HAMP domain-containing histidine kinase [Flavisolibacter sp.]